MSNHPTKRFTLCPIEKGDLETISTWFHDVEDLSCFDRTSRIPLNQIQTEQLWDDILGTSNDSGNCWFTIKSETNGTLGLVGLDAISYINRDAVIPLFVDKSVRRHGVGIRATALLLEFAFRQLGLNRATSYYRADNVSSQILLERLGFQVEGTMRQAWFADGQFHDMLVVGILRQDWMDRRQALAADLDRETVVMFATEGSTDWSWPPQDFSEG